jgi:hypothetical protein
MTGRTREHQQVSSQPPSRGVNQYPSGGGHHRNMDAGIGASTFAVSKGMTTAASLRSQ